MIGDRSCSKVQSEFNELPSRIAVDLSKGAELLADIQQRTNPIEVAHPFTLLLPLPSTPSTTGCTEICCRDLGVPTKNRQGVNIDGDIGHGPGDSRSPGRLAACVLCGGDQPITLVLDQACSVKKTNEGVSPLRQGYALSATSTSPAPFKTWPRTSACLGVISKNLSSPIGSVAFSGSSPVNA